MGAAVWASSHGIHGALGFDKLARLIDLAVSIPLGMLVLYIVCRLLKVAELEFAVQSLAGPLQRRLPFLRGEIQ